MEPLQLEGASVASKPQRVSTVVVHEMVDGATTLIGRELGEDAVVLITAALAIPALSEGFFGSSSGDNSTVEQSGQVAVAVSIAMVLENSLSVCCIALLLYSNIPVSVSLLDLSISSIAGGVFGSCCLVVQMVACRT